MNRPLIHRFLALIFVSAFCLSNVGIPVVLASCPMIGASSDACPMCRDHAASKVQNITADAGKPCCTRIVVGERNTTEFIQTQDVKRQRHDYAGDGVAFQNHEIIRTLAAHRDAVGTLLFPHIYRDIPVLTSSLLI